MNHIRRNHMYLAKELKPWHIKIVLDALKIKWDQDRVNEKGWVYTSSPLRKDKRHTFGICVTEGWFKDWIDEDTKGDIITLVMLMKGLDKRSAEDWIANTVNRNLYPPIYKR